MQVVHITNACLAASFLVFRTAEATILTTHHVIVALRIRHRWRVRRRYSLVCFSIGSLRPPRPFHALF
ncbi:hypothetical protein QBC46DRAFT_296964 [Diplogelasinospora grovesii]|uniref:Secreted protein n=1 Tax=Diplogelasinospora grovesii TaxID=303347 RepID=A0AAN6RZW3_9PEZI|nr:hypothetical protein QBC46DRAFT_296964 [Diplogelasinospora grovesii]